MNATRTALVLSALLTGLQPTTTGRTERKPLARQPHWTEEGMTLGDLVNTAGDRRLDDLCEGLKRGTC